MATTVNTAFREFLTNTVNLHPDETSGARKSRDWLVRQIAAIADRAAEFPPLYEEVHIHYGSFARRTKISPLDDLDMVIGLKGLGTTYLDVGGTTQLTVPDGIALRDLCFDNSSLLNSRRLINYFVSKLSEVPQYANSEIKRSGSAAVLNLTSYPWSFDIVPGFMTSPEWNGRSYYIIPDGEGHWMKTDPRIDQERVSAVNQRHDGYVLEPLRLMKYWNRRATMPTMQSYALECCVVNYYDRAGSDATRYPDLAVAHLLSHVSSAVLGAINDPKNIEGDINRLTWAEKCAVASRANEDARRAQSALELEWSGDHKGAIDTWRGIFGPAFPKYTA